jgi:hypothetical protein
MRPDFDTKGAFESASGVRVTVALPRAGDIEQGALCSAVWDIAPCAKAFKSQAQPQPCRELA